MKPTNNVIDLKFFIQNNSRSNFCRSQVLIKIISKLNSNIKYISLPGVLSAYHPGQVPLPIISIASISLWGGTTQKFFTLLSKSLVTPFTYAKFSLGHFLTQIYKKK